MRLFGYSIAEIIDLEVCLVPLNPTLFPGVDEAVLVHQGFSGSHGRYADSLVSYIICRSQCNYY